MAKIIKVCGLQNKEVGQVAIDKGADLLGMIMLRDVRRSIEIENAKALTKIVRDTRFAKHRQFQTIKEIITHVSNSEFESVEELISMVSELIIENGPFAVGVFRNQPISDVFRLSEEVGLDIIQLHGNENKLEYCNYNAAHFDLKFGIIPRFVIPNDTSLIYTTLDEIFIGGKYFGNGFLLPLLDGDMGGEGKVIDWTAVKQLSQGQFLIAGGLTEFNIQELAGYNNLIGFDVSGGVETNGEKDVTKIVNFIKVGKLIA